MPVVPELRQVGFQVGLVEVFGQAHPGQAAKRLLQVGVAAEIEVNLEGVGAVSRANMRSKAKIPLMLLCFPMPGCLF